jgi:hypothetical protein
MVHVQEARYLHDYVLWLRFSDGTAGEVDLADELSGPLFGPLRDLERFRTVRLDPELDTVCWDNGADLAPEYLRERVRVVA